MTAHFQDTSSPETVTPPKPVQAAGEHVLVPRKATEVMIAKARQTLPGIHDDLCDADLEDIYETMLTASPALQAQPDAPDVPGAAKLIDRLVRIADSSKRENGDDIPLGWTCREAASILSAITLMPSGDRALREAIAFVEKLQDEYARDFGVYDPSINATEFSGSAEAVDGTYTEILDGLRALAAHPSASQEPAAERFDYVSDARARNHFGIEDDEALPDGRVRVCAGEWVRIPGGYYFDASAGLLHPETATPKTPSQKTRLRELEQ